MRTEISPMLAVGDGNGAIDFYKAAFNATEAHGAAAHPSLAISSGVQPISAISFFAPLMPHGAGSRCTRKLWLPGPQSIVLLKNTSTQQSEHSQFGGCCKVPLWTHSAICGSLGKSLNRIF